MDMLDDSKDNTLIEYSNERAHCVDDSDENIWTMQEEARTMLTKMSQ